MSDDLTAFVMGMKRDPFTDRAKLARAILNRELRPLLPPTLTKRVMGRPLTLDTAGMDDDAIVVLNLAMDRPPRAWTRLTVATIKAMRACVWVAESPSDDRALDHLGLMLADVAAAQAKHAATSSGGKGRAGSAAMKEKIARVQAEAAKPRPHIPARSKTTLVARRARVDRKTAAKYA